MQPNEALQVDAKRLVQHINQTPTDWRAYVDLVNVLVASDNLVAAEELALKSLGLFQTDPVAQQQLFYVTGNVYYVAGKYDLAAQFFAKITDLELLHDATLMQAQAWYGQQHYQKALVFGLTAVDQQPTDVAAQVLLGNIWLNLQDMSAAGASFEEALSLEPANFAANFGRGLVAAMTGNLQNEWFTQAQQLAPEQYEQQVQQLDDIINTLLGGHRN